MHFDNAVGNKSFLWLVYYQKFTLLYQNFVILGKILYGQGTTLFGSSVPYVTSIVFICLAVI